MLTIPDIRTAVENQNVFVLDEHARGGSFVKDRRGRLLAYAGGFTVVFPYTVNAEKWAFRCWHTDLGDVKQRFVTISNAINKSNSRYLCDFLYCDEGIIVDGNRYPATRMRWIDGITIKDYICANKNDKNKLQSLARNFLEMTKDMHKHEFAHGDLQHGNIIANDNGDLYLVDYDSFYCKELRGEPDIIVGLRDYQHPSRKTNKYATEKIDYFSELIIYLSILAIAENPDLADKYKVKDSDRLLFSAEDFSCIKQTQIYQDILRLGGVFDYLLQILELYLFEHNIDNLLPLDVLLDQLGKEPNIVRFDVDGGTKVIEGTPIKLSWKIENYTDVTLNGTSVKTKDNFNEVVYADKQYKLEVKNGNKRVVQIINVKVYKKPIVKFICNKNKLKGDKLEPIKLSWDVQYASVVKLFENDTELQQCNSKDTLTLQPIHSVVYKLIVVGLDGMFTTEKVVDIQVFNSSTIDFEVDKQYVFPSIPIVFKWDVKDAVSVKLNGKEVKHKAIFAIEEGIEKDSVFELEVTDHFETKKEMLEVKLLQPPQIKQILLPVPNIIAQLNVSVAVDFPNTSFIKFSKLDKANSEIETEYPRNKYKPLWSEIKQLLMSVKQKMQNEYEK